MSDQTTKEMGQAGTPTQAPASPDARPLKAERPIPVTRPKDATGKSAKIAPRKTTSGKGTSDKKKAQGKPTSKRGAKTTNDAKNAASTKRKSHRFTRKQIIIGLIIFILIFDVALVTFLFGRGEGSNVPPHSDPYALIQGQMSNNRNIAEVGYDSALTFANYTDLTIVNTSSLKPIENDLLKSGAGPGGADVFYDEQIVGRILKLNSDWVNYLNQGDKSIFSSVQEGSAAQTKLTELGAGSGIAYHRIALGEIRHTGKNYYIIARASYTLTKDGQLDIHDDLFIYKLGVQSNGMIVVDFELIAPNASLEQSPDISPIESGDVPVETPVEMPDEEMMTEPSDDEMSTETPDDEMSTEPSDETSSEG
jgi:hypothetical protein